MVSLGLSSDVDFLKKVMKAISPDKFYPGQDDKSYIQGHFKISEFLSLFRLDQTSDCLVEALKEEVFQSL